jgi:biotin carboxylase
MGDRYLQITCSDPDAAAQAIAHLGEKTPIDGVVAADDQGVMVAARASSLLGLRGNTPEAAAATRDKHLMRRALAAAEVGQPVFHAVEPGDDLEVAAGRVGYPLVVKPLDRSASQGVIRVDRPQDLVSAADRVRGIVGAGATLLLESFVPGSEVAVEGLMRDGELTVLAVFDKPSMTDGPYFPETIFVTPSRLEPGPLAEAERVAAGAVRGLGLTTGPVHVELRIEGQRARVIEVAARSIGGLCSRSLSFGLMGTTLEALILRNALDLDKPGLQKREHAASGVLMVPIPRRGRLAGFRGEQETRAIPGVTGIDFTMVAGQEILPPPEGDAYLAFVYARGSDPDMVEKALRQAEGTLEVQLEG